MNEFIVDFINSDFRPIIEECEKFCLIVRGIEFQKISVTKLDELLKEIVKIKTLMIKNLDEDASNCCLSLEMTAYALQHELKFWISLKEDRMGDAWDELIRAESNASNAISAHIISGHLVDYLYRLEILEKLMFPTMAFFSPGFVILSSQCTICDSEYGFCDHLKGLPYMGKICRRKITEMKIQEVSIVPKPANRHARVVSMTLDGKLRDILTWREIQKTDI
jgi:hypothetical protein